MIRDGNERINMQVEIVLRISQLDKKDNIINKNECDGHKIITEALFHLDLLLKNSTASIDISLSAKQTSINGSHTDLVNVFVNILENSIKYSKSQPIIKVSTNDEDDFFTTKIYEKGRGMSSIVKGKIFDNFFRETKEKIHEIKGNGLG